MSMARNKVLIKVSGKIINPDNPGLVKDYADVIRELTMRGYGVVVVVGGGTYARKYVECARIMGLSEARADMVGIEISRVNALLLAYMLGDVAYTPIPRSVEEVEKAWSSGKVVVLGGLQPGQSTAGTAAVVAELLGIKLVLYATDVDGVYDRDPKRFPDAKKFDRITVDELMKVMSQRYEAGGYELLDPVAIGIVKRSSIEIVVFNGFKPRNIIKALDKSIGTLIIPS